MRIASILIARYLLAFALVIFLSINVGGCGASGHSTLARSSAPVTLGSVERPTPDHSRELASACDTYRARLRHSPVRLSDGTPVWCY